MLNDERHVALMPIHRCPDCQKGGMTLDGYKSHWYWAHHSGTKPRPPYVLDAMANEVESRQHSPSRTGEQSAQ